jgi:ribose 5-phosphate isomerase
MSTTNLPPVANAGGPPTATGGTILHVPAEAAVFDQEFLDNYDLDVDGGDEYTLDHKMVHYCGGVITQSHWIACKARLAVLHSLLVLQPARC